MKRFISSRLKPFSHAAFRRFFLSQTLSLVGTWSSDLARAYLVLEMMKSASSLGAVMLAAALPALFLTLHGGVLVDRVNVVRLMMITKSLLAVLALFLAWATQAEQLTFTILLAVAAFEGMITSFDMPAYQAMSVRLVPREDFQQALAINSTNFHMARMLGPLVAGLLMAWKGPAFVFLFDGLTYLVLVAVLSTIEIKSSETKESTAGAWQSLVDGLRYLWKSFGVRFKVLQLALTWFTILPMMVVVFRTYIQSKFNLKADDFGFLLTLPALGSMAGAFTFAAVQPKKPIRALWVGVPGVVLAVALVPFLNSPWVSAVTMAFAGFFLYLNFASLTVSIQLEIEDSFRGRVSSVVALGFGSLGPLACFPIGGITDRIGFEPSIWGLTTIFTVGSVVLAILHHRHHPITTSA